LTGKQWHVFPVARRCLFGCSVLQFEPALVCCDTTDAGDVFSKYTWIELQVQRMLETSSAGNWMLMLCMFDLNIRWALTWSCVSVMDVT
jgi:hypothetical protein